MPSPIMDFELSEQQCQWQEAAIAFARDRLAHDVVERDHSESFDREGWGQCARFGVLGMPVPEEYGGLGMGILELLAVMEGLGYGARDQGLLFSINAHLWTNTIPILLHGSDEQRARLLPGLSDGSLIGANAASEPDAGSDVFAMRTRAVRDGDHYVLDGTKTFVTNAPVASLFATYATVNPELGPMGVTCFLVERESPGLSVGEEISKMGLRTSPMAEVVFEGCRVPVANRLGREGRGAEVFESSMEWERGCILACCLGVMRRQLEQCVEHARQREQFGSPIGQFQGVSSRIADMKVRLDASRLLVYRIGCLKERGVDASMEAAVAKLHVSESFVRSSQDAVQIFGGYGYTTEQELERDLRDSIAGTLYSGTSEIQRNIVSGFLAKRTTVL